VVAGRGDRPIGLGGGERYVRGGGVLARTRRAANPRRSASPLEPGVPGLAGRGRAAFLGVYVFTQLDLVVAQRYLPKETFGAYGAAGLFGRAIVYFAGPVLVVLFTARSGQDRADRVTRTHLLAYGALLVAGAVG